MLLALLLACDLAFDAPSVIKESQAAVPARRSTPAVEPPSAQARTEDERNTIDVFEAAGPATVYVTQRQVVQSFWSTRAMEIPAGTGSGFIWDEDGHVVTNYHVVKGGSSFTVTLANQQTYDAKVVGTEPRKDIAVLELLDGPDDVVPIRLPPDGYSPVVGQKTLAIGNPFGLDHTLTTGVVSALGREVQGAGGVEIRDMIQTDASINPGNSGGPLLDSSGQLMGMNTMIYSKSGSSAGIGFAVPVDTIRRVVPQIIETGKAEQVGIGVVPLDDRYARRLGIDGVIIQDVTPDSPAARAGLTGMRLSDRGGVYVGDVIVGIAGETVGNYSDLYNAMFGRKPGDTVRVELLRGKERVEVDIELVVLQ